MSAYPWVTAQFPPVYFSATDQDILTQTRLNHWLKSLKVWVLMSVRKYTPKIMPKILIMILTSICGLKPVMKFLISRSSSSNVILELD
jgi:hypothetical protein